MGSLPQLSIIKGTQKSFEKRLLHKLLEENIDKSYGMNVAVIDETNNERVEKLTYHALNSSSNRIARIILDNCKSCKPNSDDDWIVAVCMPPSKDLLITLLAIWKCGAAYLPLDVSFPSNRIKHILTEAKPVLVIYDEQSYQDIENFDGVSSIGFSEMDKLKENFSNANITGAEAFTSEDDNVAIVLYTSGSTGIPKGVRIPHSVILNRLQWQWAVFPVSPSEKYSIFKTSLTFVDSVSEIWSPILNGK